MSTDIPMPAAAATAPDDPVRHGLADPEVARRLSALIRTALGQYPAGLTLTQRASEVEEMFQEVSKRALASAHGFDPEQGSLVNWLGGIVWNVAKHRKPLRLIATEPTALQETLIAAGKAIPDEVAHHIDSQEILDRLPPADAELLELHSQGWTAKEIGDRLTLKPGTVRVRLSRLLKCVRSMYDSTNLEADHD